MAENEDKPSAQAPAAEISTPEMDALKNITVKLLQKFTPRDDMQSLCLHIGATTLNAITADSAGSGPPEDTVKEYTMFLFGMFKQPPRVEQAEATPEGATSAAPENKSPGELITELEVIFLPTSVNVYPSEGSTIEGILIQLNALGRGRDRAKTGGFGNLSHNKFDGNSKLWHNAVGGGTSTIANGDQFYGRDVWPKTAAGAKA
ncbi:hypothetical protein MKEN_00203700 [Mycena kentingensis (nom. inval.)]|nr:hypothetical protein MKEN_00203700 [Mycena kentingensis (nom. inval.)]